MKLPKKIYKPVLFTFGIFWLLSIVFILIFGFEKVQMYFGFFCNFITLPVSISNLLSLLYILDEEKLINRTLIEAGKKDQENWDKEKERMRSKK